MFLINPQNEYPRYIGDLQISHPAWKIGDPLPAGWLEVADAEPPITTNNEVWEEQFPTEIEGVLKRNFIVRPLTAEEIEQKNAPETAQTKLAELGFNQYEIRFITRGLFG